MSWCVLISAFVLVISSSAIAQNGLKVPKAGAKPPATKAPAGAGGQAGAASTDEAERAKTMERILECLAPGLPQDWWRAWVELVVEKEETAWNQRIFEGRFFYLTNTERTKSQDLKSCDPKEVAELAISLNQFLDPEKKRWNSLKLEFNREGGSFALKYSYGR